MADEPGTRTILRRCTALTLTILLLTPCTAAADRLRTIDVATGASAILASSPNLEWIDRPCWAPDGRLVALEYRSTRWTLQRRYVAYDAQRNRQVLGRASRFTTDAALAPGCAVVAERRRRIPLAGRGVVVRPLAGATLFTVPTFARRGGAHVAWSRDGALVADLDDSAGTTVRVSESATGRLVAEVAVSAYSAELAEAAFAPDGRSVALATSDLAVPRMEVVIVDLETRTFRHLAHTQRLGAVAWSPRGDRIAVVDESGVRLFHPDGRDLGVISSDAPVGDLAWSPDGASIAFTTSHPTGTRHYVVAAEHDAARRLLLATRALSSTPLAWSPDGTRIAVGGG